MYEAFLSDCFVRSNNLNWDSVVYKYLRGIRGHLFKELKTLQEYIIDSILTFLANIFMSKSNISS